MPQREDVWHEVNKELRQHRVLAGRQVRNASPQAWTSPTAHRGGNVVAAWVANVDEGAVRKTADGDILIARSDLAVAKAAMLAAGFSTGMWRGSIFSRQPDASPRSAVRIAFAHELVKAGEYAPNPDLSESVEGPFPRARSGGAGADQLPAFRDKGRTYPRDFIGVRLIGASWGG